MKCKVCDGNVVKKFDARVMNKYDIEYFQCPRCRFMQTEQPYWLKESYADNAVSVSDTGVLSRNLHLAALSSVIIYFLLDSKAKFLDYGGGYGLLTRFMRDRGFDFYWYDPFAKNIFAKGFEGSADGSKKYEAITSFENFEHFTDPAHELERLVKLADTVILSTELLPEQAPSPAEWWYYCLEHGQHVSLYSYESLKHLADRYGLTLYSNRKNFHVLTRKSFPGWKFYFLAKTAFWGLSWIAKLSPRTGEDMVHVQELLATGKFL